MKTLFPASFLLSLAAISSPVSASTSAVTAVASGHGVRLQLTLKRATYPRDALIHVRLTVTNRSRRFVHLCGFCLSAPVTAEVLTRAGTVVYPTSLPDMPILRGPGPDRREKIGIPAGKTMTTWQYVILGSNRIRAVLQLGLGGEQGHLVTPTIHAKLVNAPAPTLHLVLHPTVMVHVESLPPTSSPLLYTFSYQCASGGSGGSDWVPAMGQVITPDISPDRGELIELHMIAGRLGHPVGRLDYMKRSTAR